MEPALGLDWNLRGPDAEGQVWLDRAELDDLDLGAANPVRARLSAFCRQAESGKAETDGAILHWQLEGPDTGGVVMLLWEGAEPQNFRLGHVEPVVAEFRRWLGAATPA